MMKYSKIQGIDMPISDFIFGGCNPLLIEDKPGAEDLLSLAFSKGFNTFDNAKVYGKSEEVLGRWIQHTGNRDKVVIITKGCHPESLSRLNTNCLIEDVESSLERLQTDYIDIYMLHRDDSRADIKDILLTLNSYLNRGVIRKIGVSNWTHERIEEANRIAKENGLEGFTVSSPQMSLARQVRDPWGGGCVSISYDTNALEWYRSHSGIMVLPYSCLGRGLFAGKISSNHPFQLFRSLDSPARKGYWCRENIRRLREAEKTARDKGCTVAQLSLAWCRNQGFAVHPIITVSSKVRMTDSIKSLEIEFSGEEIFP